MGRHAKTQLLIEAAAIVLRESNPMTVRQVFYQATLTGVLEPRHAQEAGDRQVNTLAWTHVMLVDAAVDIRDAYTGQETMAEQDSVYIKDQSGRRYLVIFIEEVQTGPIESDEKVTVSVVDLKP